VPFGGKFLQLVKFVKKKRKHGFSAKKSHFVQNQKKRKEKKKNTKQHNVQGAHHPTPPAPTPTYHCCTSVTKPWQIR
jgi:hypothetical protein